MNGSAIKALKNNLKLKVMKSKEVLEILFNGKRAKT